MLSIIIPALNEEEYLPRLLESVKKQGFSDYELILADAGSTDSTLAIAGQYGCRVIEGGMPARGRNNGARAAKGDLLFFLDADTVLPDQFLQNSLAEFNHRNLDIAGFRLQPYPKSRWTSFLLDLFYNYMVVATQPFLPHAAMGTLVKKDLFQKVGGFDEQIRLAEDHEFARRAARYGKFGIVRFTPILFSDRRFKKEGWVALGFKYFLCGLYTTFIGPIKSDIFNYKFNHYKNDV